MRNLNNHVATEQAVKHVKEDASRRGNNSHTFAEVTSHEKDIPRLQQKYFAEVERKLAAIPGRGIRSMAST